MKTIYKSFDESTNRRIEKLSRRDFGKGLAAMLAAGVAPSVGAARRGVAARAAMLAGGGGLSSLDYVGAKEAAAGETTPLIGMWDGIENAGWGTTDAGATVWTDLVGSVDMDVTAGSYWSVKGLTRDNANSNYGVCYKSVTSAYRDQIKMAEICCEVTKGQSASVVALWLWSITNTTSKGILLNTSFIQYDTRLVDVSMSLPFVGTFSGSNSGVWKDAVKLDYTGATDTWNGNNIIAVFGRGTSNYMGAGTAHSVRLYNRVLTEEEIAANYAVDQARFGLA